MSVVSAKSALQFRTVPEAGMSPSGLARALRGKKVIIVDQVDALRDVLGLGLIDVAAEVE